MNDQNRTESIGKNDTPPDTLPRLPGTYILFLTLSQPITVQIGRIGTHTLSPGLLAYVGSAHGPGGLRARILRHLRREKTIHWHIDRLTQLIPVQAVWFAPTTERLECTWAGYLSRHSGIKPPVPGFGASDCACDTHLFALETLQLPALWTGLQETATELTRYDT